MNSTEISAENFFKTLYQRYQELQKTESAIETKPLETSSKKSSLMLKRLVNPVTDAPSVTRPIVLNQFIGQVIQTENDINFSKFNGTSDSKENLEATSIPNQKTQPQPMSQQQVSYVDDEDMENDYGETEASGGNKPNWNDTTILLSSDIDDND